MDVMLAGMTARQMAEWQAFWQIEPFGELREDWRWSCLLAMLANMVRGEKGESILPQEMMAMLDPTGETEQPLTASERATQQFEDMWQAMLGE